MLCNNYFTFLMKLHTIICLQVSNNGYISMGAQVNITTPTIPGTNSIVSPYGADIDTSVTGTVRYTTEFITYYPGYYYNPYSPRTLDYILNGARIMVVEWDCVPLHGLSDPADVCLHAHFIMEFKIVKECSFYLLSEHYQ